MIQSSRRDTSLLHYSLLIIHSIRGWGLLQICNSTVPCVSLFGKDCILCVGDGVLDVPHAGTIHGAYRRDVQRPSPTGAVSISTVIARTAEPSIQLQFRYNPQPRFARQPPERGHESQNNVSIGANRYPISSHFVRSSSKIAALVAEVACKSTTAPLWVRGSSLSKACQGVGWALLSQSA